MSARLELRVTREQVAIHRSGDGECLAVHRRAGTRGAWVVDPAHWAGLPDGHGRATTTDPPPCLADAHPAPDARAADLLAALLTASAAAATPVARRPLADYAAAVAGLAGGGPR